MHPGGVGWMVKKYNAPERACKSQIVFQPGQHFAISLYGLLQRSIGIERNNVSVPPIERIVSATIIDRHGSLRHGVKSQIRCRIIRHVVVITGRSEKWNTTHQTAVIREVVRLVLRKGTVHVGNVTDMQN